MDTTSYGYENPVSGDPSKGANGWMRAINFDIDRLNAHSHNGVDSVLLTSAAIVPATVTAASGSWIINPGGTDLPQSGYVQTVTVPASIGEINNFHLSFLISTAGTRQYQPLSLFYVRQTATTFKLYCNDNTISVLCVFR